MQQRLNLRPLPHGQGWLRPGLAAGDGEGDCAVGRPRIARAASRRTAAGVCGSARIASIAASAWPASDWVCSRQASSWSRRASIRASRKMGERTQLAIVLRWTPTNRAAAVAVEPADNRTIARCWAGARRWLGATDSLLDCREAHAQAGMAGLRREVVDWAGDRFLLRR